MASVAESVATRPEQASLSVRFATEPDVPALIQLINRLAREATLLFVVPIDPETGAEDLRQFLRAAAASGNNAVFVAALGDEMAGLVTATGGVHPAKRAAVEVGIGVLEAHRGCGIGRALMAALEDWARAVRIHRLQLPVVATNAAAIALYRKAGFTTEGVLRESVMLDGRPADQLMMAKLLG